MNNLKLTLLIAASIPFLLSLYTPVMANQEMDRIRNKWIESSPDQRVADKLNSASVGSEEAVKSGKSMFDKMLASGQEMPKWMFETLFSSDDSGINRADQTVPIERDPFALTPQTFLGVSKVEQAMEFVRHNQSSQDTLVVPSSRRITAKDLPKMTLKGVADRGSGDLAALLKIEGIGVRVVRTGDTIGLQAVGKDTAIQVIKVDHHQIIVEAGDLKTAIVVQ